MKVIINVVDSWMGVDGVHTFGFDCTGIDSTIHAVDWDDSVNKGTIEYKVVETPNKECTSVEEVDAGLGVTLQSILDQKDKFIADQEKERKDYLASL